MHTLHGWDWSRYPNLAAARARSRDWLSRIRDALASLDESVPSLRSVAVAGSLARLDAGHEADCDLLLILADDATSAATTRDQAMEEAWCRLESTGMQRPLSDGIFGRPTSRTELCDGPRGVVAEDMRTFGQRIHLLLEAHPIIGEPACRALQNAILNRYAHHPFTTRPGERWSYLRDDLIRYWRSYRVWRHWGWPYGERQLVSPESQATIQSPAQLCCIALHLRWRER